MQNSLSSGRQLLISYLQELNDTKSQQIEYYTHWAQYHGSEQFRHFFAEQKRHAYRQYSALKALAEILNIHSSGKPRSPVRNLLHEAKNVSHLARQGDDQGATESMIARLLQGVKRHEMITIRGALALAKNLEETKVARTLTEILEEEEQTYLLLQNFVGNRRQNDKIVTHTKVGDYK